MRNVVIIAIVHTVNSKLTSGLQKGWANNSDAVGRLSGSLENKNAKTRFSINNQVVKNVGVYTYMVKHSSKKFRATSDMFSGRGGVL